MQYTNDGKWCHKTVENWETRLTIVRQIKPLRVNLKVVEPLEENSVNQHINAYNATKEDGAVKNEPT